MLFVNKITPNALVSFVPPSLVAFWEQPRSYEPAFMALYLDTYMQ